MLTKYLFWPLWRIRRTNTFTTFITLPVKESFETISFVKPLEVSYFMMFFRKRDVVKSVKIKLLFCHSKWFFGFCALDSPVEDIIRYFGDVFWEFRCWDDLVYFWKRFTIVRPVKSPIYRLFSSKGVVENGNRLVVSVRAQVWRKVFPHSPVDCICSTIRGTSFSYSSFVYCLLRMQY